MLAGVGAALVTAGAGVGGWRAASGSMADYATYAARLRGNLAPPDLQAVVRYATLAANGHNTQPWSFRLETQAMEIRPDLRRRTPVVDPDDHHLYVSLGCAAANLALAAAATGRPGELSFAADGGVRYDYLPGQPRLDPLVGAIPRRQCTRAEYDGRTIPAAVLAEIERAAATPGVSLALVTDRARINRARDLVLAGNRDQMNNPAFMHELKQWIRFNPRSAMATGDGLFSAASGNPVLPTDLGRFAFDRLFNIAEEDRKHARQIDSSAGIAIFFGERADPEHWIRVGQACQRFALAATHLGLKIAFINQPVEVAQLRADLAAVVGETRRPDILIRFGYGPALPFSPRRSASYTSTA
ncbi:Tat pathway signal protein [Bradyrhizobium sp. NAS96.2]|uniref:Acg family FMN-binding oxidoreductase n=1 Tax=Bradyrhizobium sp. NAS96.2 TaxID=1680160 RepID=UPI000AAB488C